MPREEEVDLWWGSCAGRTMTPSFAVCLLLTAVIYVVVREVVRERGWSQLAFVAVAGLLWLVQLLRWGHRFFTCNYRLTTRYLYVDRGVRPLVAQRYPLQSIQRIEVRGSWWANLIGVADLWVLFKDAATTPAVLRGLCNPERTAELIREAVSKPT